MWRDVYEHALDLFYQIFTSLEDQETLNPDNEVHLFALHGFSFHWFSKASTLFEMLGTSTVLELKGISHHSNSGEVTESKALRRILLRFLKNMGSIGTDLTAFIEALCQSRGSAGP
ncbi:hypothetical protein J4Q44_G00128330 [Coregonus suidteri]|uniref:Integrase core domain-containing protein n=1 Tax=Coregonus suidteri TaxID=861788 RepID=A0AAN8R014_9TELE